MSIEKSYEKFDVLSDPHIEELRRSMAEDIGLPPEATFCEIFDKDSTFLGLVDAQKDEFPEEATPLVDDIAHSV